MQWEPNHETQQSTKGERSASRDILTLKKYISSRAFFAHTNVFHHGGKPVPIELPIASIPEDDKDPEVICLKVDHSNLLTTPEDSRDNHYINEQIHLKNPCLDPCLSNSSLSASGVNVVTWPKETEALSSSKELIREIF
ncbi:uncharacterized protein TNCV_875001 [Trichonephila clavipes]|nr:uncharacterized protein TNCV_875001 [Trichonephila clavipes]